MTPTKRLNFFDLLEINPADSLSEADLDALLARKGAEWTKKARNPKVGVQFTGYRQLIPDIRKVMLDPAQRRAEADAYHVLMKAKKEAAIQQLEISAGLDAAKGYITPEQVNQLVTGSGGFLTQPEVRQELKRMSIPVRTDSARATPTTPTVTPTARSTMQEIRISLNDLGLKQGATLYDFLELADSTDTRTLHQKATEIYKFTQDAPVKTMEITARSKLSGHGMNIFKNEATREQYTAALEHQFYEDLLNEQVTRLL